MGDFNINLLQYNSNSKTNDFLDDVFSIGFVPVILKPTRITDTTATLLDHIYTNNITELKQSAIIITDVADHLGTSVFFDTNKKTPQKQTTLISRDFCENNIKQFKNYLLLQDFTAVFRSECPEESYSTFLKIYQSGFEQCFPLREKKINSKKKYQPWYTKELKLASKLKTESYKAKLQNPTVRNIERYKTHLKSYNSLRKNLKMTYYKNKLNEYKYNIKKLWSFINKTTGKTNDNIKYPTNLIINDKKVTNRETISNSFNQLFTNVGKETNQRIPKVRKNYSSYLPNLQPNSLFVTPLN